jgi:hypothetical protein
VGPAALGEGDPGPTQGAHGGGVAAALGRPVTTEPEHVRPRPQPEPLDLGAATQRPGRPNELSHMRRQPVEALQVVGITEPLVEAGAEALGALGGVLGDVAGHLLGAQLPGLVVAGDVADVELLAPAGEPARPTRSGPPSSRGGQGT